MKKNQSGRLSNQQKKSGGPKGIFSHEAQEHDISLRKISMIFFEQLKKQYPALEFRYRKSISKKEINEKLNQIDSRLGKTLFLKHATIKPDGGIIEVKDKQGKWRVILVSEAKYQGKDIENIRKGILVGKNKDQDTMAAGNAIERSHKNINEIRNYMLDEKHFPYVLFLQGSNFLTETLQIQRPDGRVVTLKYDDSTLNRIDRLTAANYSMPLNTNLCKNIFVKIDDREVMLQAASIYVKTFPWTSEEILSVMNEIARTSLKILGLI